MGEQAGGTQPIKRLCAGLLAHVDSGKTTLSEALLFGAGQLRKLGRVDHRNAFLDTDALERARGITIFSKQAVLKLPHSQVTLLDTPGHVDFSAEAERALQVLDYAVLVISGVDGVQSHTETLWRLLERYQVPVFLFVNKMDLAGADRAGRMEELRRRFGPGCVDLSDPDSAEDLALCSEQLLETILEGNQPTHRQLAEAVAQRRLFPCFFGSALKLQGVEELLAALEELTLPLPSREGFGAKIFKITRDDNGTRLTWLKVTGGELKVKAQLSARPDARVPWTGKADQLRLYNGAKSQLVEAALPGMVVAVAGLEDTYPGEGLGFEEDAVPPALEPVLRYRVLLPDGCDVHTALRQLRELEQEDPMLHVVWDSRLGQVHLQLMGEVQLEILQSLLERRFHLKVSFDEGGILYKETITQRVEGVGHFEPLRHYAEVHLVLEPGPRGSGVEIGTSCREDALEGSWQRLILTHLAEKTHLGPCLGAPLTDVKITLAAGRAHVKHTEGGDFRQATYRAVRQGLRTAQAQGACLLLEPWYQFTLRLPQEALGRALADMPRLFADFQPPEAQGEEAVLTGKAPVACLRTYAREVAAYTKGRGLLSCLPAGYAPCHNPEEVMAAAGYEIDADLENTADSVFCSHGAGVVVRWDQVPQHMHLPSVLARGERMARAAQEQEEEQTPRTVEERAAAYRSAVAQDKELMAIFERTYGPVRRDPLQAMRPKPQRPQGIKTAPVRGKSSQREGPEHLLVDGYNVIFSWEELKALAQESLEAARGRLMDILCNYAAYRQCVPILVFDAYKVKGGAGSVEHYHNLHVVYTKEAETADMYIEKATHKIAKRFRTRVVTSDATEQLIILGAGALRVSSQAFRQEVDEAQREIRWILEQAQPAAPQKS